MNYLSAKYDATQDASAHYMYYHILSEVQQALL